ncbi:MAG: hypothetical protein N3A72_10140 [bacterium]|nr:hypothetical protein [bacterium]
MPQKSPYKSVLLAVLLSVLYPGLGHYYVGSYLPAILWAIIGFITQWFIYSCYSSPLGFNEAGGWSYVIIYLAIIVASSIRAYIVAVKKNQHIEHLEKTKKEASQRDRSYDLLPRR